MMAAQLEQEVRARHAAGASPKEIARALGLRPSAVASIVRRVAGQRPAGAQGAAVRGCWVSPGWSHGLTIDGDRDWPEAEGVTGSGLVCVLVAREHRYGKVSVCGYLVDVYCLGVKNALGPRVMGEPELSAFLPGYFRAYQHAPLPAPIELARHLVLGAIDYARDLGFDPHPDFERARGHLGELSVPCAIRFGCKGQPLFVQGPNDDPDRILRRLDERVGRGKSHFSLPLVPRSPGR